MVVYAIQYERWTMIVKPRWIIADQNGTPKQMEMKNQNPFKKVLRLSMALVLISAMIDGKKKFKDYIQLLNLSLWISIN